MNRLQKLFALMVVPVAGAVLFYYCQSDPKPAMTSTPVPETGKQIKLEAEPELPLTGSDTFAVTEGVVYWQAKEKVSGPHNGTVNIAGGYLLVNQGRLLAGKVQLDMTSIAVSDIKDPEEKAALESHLKEKDFFEADKFPTGEFEIDEVLPSQMPDFNRVVNGTLRLRDKTHTVNVPLKLKIDGKTLQAESASFVIDRTRWGINYRSTVLNTAKDKLIEDIVLVALKISAKGK